MKVKFKKNFLIDELIWIIVIFQIMIGNLFKLTNIMSLIILFLIIISCSQNLKYYLYHNLFSLSLFFVIIIVFPFYSFLLSGGEIYTLFNNIFYVVTPMAMLIYISMCCNKKSAFLKEMLLKLSHLLNWWVIINLVVMIIQLNVNKGIYPNEVAYKDSISGLFGKYGTPTLTLFMSFVISYDFVLTHYKVDKRSKVLLFAIIISNIILASFNDNKAFYIVLPIYLASLWTVHKFEKITSYKRIRREILLFLELGIISGIGLLLLWLCVDYTRIGAFYNRIIHEITIGWEKMNLVQGSNERFGMIAFALSNKSKRFFGYGIGTSIWKQENAFGFIHFGQSDIGAFMVLGGIIFVFLISLYIFSIIKNIFKKNTISIILTLVLIVLGIYTQIFTSISMMACTTLFILTCWVVKSIELDRCYSKRSLYVY